jgi:hypothetical protein
VSLACATVDFATVSNSHSDQRSAPQPAGWCSPWTAVRGHLVRFVLEVQVLHFIAFFNRTLAKPFKWTYLGKPLHA